MEPPGGGAQGPARNAFPPPAIPRNRLWGEATSPLPFLRIKPGFLESRLLSPEPGLDPAAPPMLGCRGGARQAVLGIRALAPDLASQRALPWTALPSPTPPPPNRRAWGRLAGSSVGEARVGAAPSSPPSHCTVLPGGARQAPTLGPAEQWTQWGELGKAPSGRSADPPRSPGGGPRSAPTVCTPLWGGTRVARLLLS